MPSCVSVPSAMPLRAFVREVVHSKFPDSYKILMSYRILNNFSKIKRKKSTLHSCQICRHFKNIFLRCSDSTSLIFFSYRVHEEKPTRRRFGEVSSLEWKKKGGISCRSPARSHVGPDRRSIKVMRFGREGKERRPRTNRSGQNWIGIPDKQR